MVMEKTAEITMTIFYTHSGLEAVGALGGGPCCGEDDGDVAEAAEAAGDVEELLRGGRYQVLQVECQRFRSCELRNRLSKPLFQMNTKVNDS